MSQTRAENDVSLTWKDKQGQQESCVFVCVCMHMHMCVRVCDGAMVGMVEQIA